MGHVATCLGSQSERVVKREMGNRIFGVGEPILLSTVPSRVYEIRKEPEPLSRRLKLVCLMGMTQVKGAGRDACW